MQIYKKKLLDLLKNVEAFTLLLFCERGSVELLVSDRGVICDRAVMVRDTGTSFIL
jgi:hypothetical protein